MCWTKLDSDEVSGMLTTDAWHDLAGISWSVAAVMWNGPGHLKL